MILPWSPWVSGWQDTSVFSCESAVMAWDGSAWQQVADGNDYFGDHCTSGVVNNRGTEFDWLRMFWDLRTDKGVNPVDIFEILDQANPNSWNANGDGTGSGYPSSRMSSAANTVGGSSLQQDYDSVATFNGTDR